MANFLTRFREPSTWGGVAILFSLFGMPHEQAQSITDLLAAAAAAAAVFMPERSDPR